MKKSMAAFLPLLAAAAFAGPVRAQLPNVTPFSFEVRGGLAIPTPLIPIDPYIKAGLVYNTLRYEPRYDDETDDFTVRHVRLDVGLRLRL